MALKYYERIETPRDLGRVLVGLLVLAAIIFGLYQCVFMETKPSLSRAEAPKASAPPEGVLGVPFGSHPTPAWKVYAPPSHDGLALYVPVAPVAPFHGVPVDQALLTFDHGRLFSGDLYLKGTPAREAMKLALIGLYGRPTDFSDQSRWYNWSWPDQKVKVRLYVGPTDADTTVSFTQGE